MRSSSTLQPASASSAQICGHVRVNDALAENIALDPDEIVGRLLREVAPKNATILEPHARLAMESASRSSGSDPQRGRPLRHLVSYYPIPGRNGVTGVGTAVTDVTHLKDVETRLEETNSA